MNWFSKTFVKVRELGLPAIKKTVVAVIGGTVLLVGICLIFLPGPGTLVVIAGLAILATEFVWARRWLQRARELAARAKNALRR